MYISRIRPKIESLSDLKRFQIYDDYSFHRTIWTFFADKNSRKRDFLYRVETSRGMPTFFVVSERQPEQKLDLWNIETKFYGPQLRVGQRLAFVLRANPVVTKKNEDGKHKRHDLVMETRIKLKNSGKPSKDWPARPEIIQKEGYAWLSGKVKKLGFSITETEIRVDGYRQYRFYKANRQPPILISTLDFFGLLTVTEPEIFLKALYSGIGHSKGLGCGLLMIKRV